MLDTLTEAVGEKLQELNTKSTCKGDLSQGIVVTTEDKIKIAVGNYRNKTKFVFDWPNHLTSIFTLVVSLVSLPNDLENKKIMGIPAETWKYLIALAVIVFVCMFVRSVAYRIINRGCISAKALIDSLSKSQNILDD